MIARQGERGSTNRCRIDRTRYTIELLIVRILGCEPFRARLSTTGVANIVLPLNNTIEAVKTFTRRTLLVLACVALVSTPVAAVHDSVGCDVPPEFTPLFGLLHSFAELALVGGALIGLLGILIAGIMWMIPGPDWNRKAKSTISYVIVGTVILLSAHLIMAFIINQLGTPLC